MTESQRLWEAWFRAFTQVQQARPRHSDVRCPTGDGGQVRVAYLGDAETRIGTAFVWCQNGRHGIFLSRVGIPEGADMLTFDATEEEQSALIPADIDFSPPDPAPPADEPG